MNTITVKQLLINKLLTSSDLQEEVKSYIFLDITYVNTRNIKNKLILGLNLKLDYWQSPLGEEHWALCYGFEVQFQCESCLDCGGYTFIGNQIVYTNIAPRALCCCPGFQEYYQNNISVINAPLNIYM